MHTASLLSLAFTGSGLQGDGDEAWGLDNVQVRIGALPFDQQMNATCPSCQFNTAFSVNTRTGNYWNKVTDLQVESPGIPIAWTRTYNSQAVDATTVLGAGWQHPYNARLATPSMSGGETGRVIVTSPTGNRLRFDGSGSGPFSAWPGVNSTLTKTGSTFTQTMRDQSQYLFRDSDGMLTAVRDPQGRQLNLVYNVPTPTQLDQIVDASNSSRYLNLTYTSGRIIGVADSAVPARTVTYGYDASGNLTTVTDVRQQVTTYSYKTAANHLLTRIRNPLQQDIEQIGYKTSVSPTQVVTQTLQDKRAVAFSFPPPTALSGTTTMTSTGVDGRIDVVQLDYAGDNTLVGMRNTTNPAGIWQALSSSYDDSFSPGLMRDGNGNPTTLFNTTQGLPITVTNALGHVSINTYDSSNNLTRTLDPLGITTRYRYNTFNNVISTTAGLASVNQALATTLWTYQYKVGAAWGSTQPGATDSRLYEQTSPDSVVTRYLYDDASSQPHRVIKMIAGPGTAAEQQTTYAYDATGRVQTTTVAAGNVLARADRTDYNADNTIAKTTQNYKGTGIFSAATPDQNITTFYGYDKLGRTIAMTDTLGHVDVTRYNAKGQVEATARNIAKPWSRDAQGQPIIPAFSVATPDANIATLYGYDGLGRSVLMTETGILTGSFDLANLRFTQADSRVTRTQYDELGRSPPRATIARMTFARPPISM